MAVDGPVEFVPVHVPFLQVRDDRVQRGTGPRRAGTDWGH